MAQWALRQFYLVLKCDSFYINSFRFQCGTGCGAQYASKNYAQAKIHALDCPTRAFISSDWRPSSKSWLAEHGFFIRSDAVVEGEECTCSANPSVPCRAVHLID